MKSIQKLFTATVVLVTVTVLLCTVIQRRRGNQNSSYYDINRQHQYKTYSINKKTAHKRGTSGYSVDEKINNDTVNRDRKSTDDTESIFNTSLSIYTALKMLPDCHFHLVSEEEVQRIKQQLKIKDTPPYSYKIYLHLNLTNHSGCNISHDLPDLQLMDKKQIVLGELPIDFESLTWTLFKIYSAGLNISLSPNSMREPNTRTSDRDELLSLLWSEVLNNSSDFYLCNINDSSDFWREFIYWTTTVWLGYDLSCSSFEGGNNGNINLTKSISYIPTILCFYLSLQFVWIFSILDVKYVWIQNRLTSLFSKDNNKDEHLFSYTEVDRPCGLQRILLKALYKEFCCFKKPERKLTSYLFLIMAVIGFYRTYCLYSEFQWMMEIDRDIVRANEPLIHLFLKNHPQIGKYLDICFSIFPLLLFIVFSPLYYRSYIEKNEKYDEEESDFIAKHVSRFGKIKSLGNEMCSSERKKVCVWYMFQILFHVLIFVFPCFSFMSQCLIVKLFKDDAVNKNGEEGDPRIAVEQKNNGNGKVESNRENNVNAQNGYLSSLIITCWYICRIFVCVFLYIISYFLIIRPLLSSITFLLRSIVYITLFALPIKPSLFRYALLIVTAIFYILNYYAEILNLEREILLYILKKGKGNWPSREGGTNLEYLTESEYNAISEKLLFVKKKISLCVSKVFVVILVCIILFQVFLDSGNSETVAQIKYHLELALFFMSPYAVTVCVKANKTDFLSFAEKKVIDKAIEGLIKNRQANNSIEQPSRQN
ncbi:uncharacterized protein LOC134261989 [Saccostrea cucullata]|uniref:uncharacterized protein LOC134261989 n=1 Tax=Saccostrea cuccullata TaxID=36930 RepID=UPI002ED466B4